MNNAKQRLLLLLDHPILFPSPPSRRPFHSWSFSSLCQILKDKKLSCRVWKKSDCQILETDCDHVDLCMQEFWDWVQGKAYDDNPLQIYDRPSYAGYIDYKYMKDVFVDCLQTLQEVQWSDFGLSDFDGKDSTIWIGTEGSNTTGHQDSYGFNLVTQIVGRKMWVLFPPADTDFLYATRIPYEESSVFSQVHLGLPNIEKFPQLKSTHPLVVILHPGQTLYVPHHWWHFVESLDPSISINVWVPHREDDDSHLTESITRCLATSLLSDINSKGHNSLYNQLLNPTETLCEPSLNVGFLKHAIDKVIGSSLDNTQFSYETQEADRSTRDKHCNDLIEELVSEKKTEPCHFLHRFAEWLTSCNLIPAPTSPCLGFCENCGCSCRIDNCLLPMTGSLGDVRCAAFQNHNVSTQLNVIEKGFTSPKTKSRKRANADGGDNSNVKKYKEAKEPFHSNVTLSSKVGCMERIGHAVSITDIDSVAQSIRHGIEDVSNTERTHLLEKNKTAKQIMYTDSTEAKCFASSDQDNNRDDRTLSCVAFCLTTPFSFDHYVWLMKLKNESCDFIKLDSERSEICEKEKASSFGISRQSIICRCRKVSSVVSDTISEQSPCDSLSKLSCHNNDKFTEVSTSATLTMSTISPSDRPALTQITSISITDQEAGSSYSPGDRQIDNDKSPTYSSAPTFTQCQGVSSLPLSSTELLVSPSGCHSISKTQGIPSTSTLTLTEIQKIFFDSVLHPSVIEKISQLMKDKCTRLLCQKVIENKDGCDQEKEDG